MRRRCNGTLFQLNQILSPARFQPRTLLSRLVLYPLSYGGPHISREGGVNISQSTFAIFFKSLSSVLLEALLTVHDSNSRDYVISKIFKSLVYYIILYLKICNFQSGFKVFKNRGRCSIHFSMFNSLQEFAPDNNPIRSMEISNFQ